MTLDVKNVGAMELFKQIQKETNLFFVYNDADLIRSIIYPSLPKMRPWMFC